MSTENEKKKTRRKNKMVNQATSGHVTAKRPGFTRQGQPINDQINQPISKHINQSMSDQINQPISDQINPPISGQRGQRKSLTVVMPPRGRRGMMPLLGAQRVMPRQENTHPTKTGAELNPPHQ